MFAPSRLLPIKLNRWIEANKDRLKPPVNNGTVWQDSDFIIQIIGAPNARVDYHDDPYEEFFYQLRGNMVLRLWDNGPKDVLMEEGDVLLLPPHVPHSPQRPEPDSIGLVVERVRPRDVLDAFNWYCDRCRAMHHRVEVHVANIVVDLPRVMQEYADSAALRTCKSCGHLTPAKPLKPAMTRPALAAE